MMDYILFTIYATSIAALSIQIAYASPLVDGIKRFFGLSLPYKYNSLLKYNSWKKIIKHKFWFSCLFPFITVFMILLQFHKFLSSLLNCSFCISFWLMLATNIILLELMIPTAIVLAGFALVLVSIVEKIMQ